jgi:tetratricopeptide (TPR) repeat protein
MLRMLLRFTALVSLLFLSVTAQAQRTPRVAPIPLQIHGQIRYAEGGRPAEFILVRLENFGGGIAGETTTDRTGNFRFSGLSADLFIVSVRTAGFSEVQQQVDLRTQLTDYVQLQLVAANTSSNSSLPPKQGGVIDANVPQHARAEFEKGRVALLEASNPDEGIPHLENAVRTYPKYLEAMLLLGTAYMDKGDWDKAEQTLKRALEVDPKAANALFAMGELYLRQKKDDEAEKILLQGLQIEGRSYQGHLSLGRLYWDMASKLKDEAQWKPVLEKSYEQANLALKLNSNLAGAHLLKGNLLLRARRAEDALKEFEEYLRLEPNGEFSEQAREAVQRIKRALAKR